MHQLQVCCFVNRLSSTSGTLGITLNLCEVSLEMATEVCESGWNVCVICLWNGRYAPLQYRYITRLKITWKNFNFILLCLKPVSSFQRSFSGEISYIVISWDNIQNIFQSLKYFFAMIYHKTYITALLKYTLSMLCYAFFLILNSGVWICKVCITRVVIYLSSCAGRFVSETAVRQRLPLLRPAQTRTLASGVCWSQLR